MHSHTWIRNEGLAGLLAGAAGGAAYAATMAADLRLLQYNANDYLLLGGALGLRPQAASRVGKGIHAVNSVALGMLFERFVYRRLPYSPAVNGAIFATIENAVLYPLLIVEHLHPLIRNGELPSYWNGTAFAQAVARHLAYGACAGWTLDRMLKLQAREGGLSGRD